MNAVNHPLVALLVVLFTLFAAPLAAAEVSCPRECGDPPDREYKSANGLCSSRPQADMRVFCRSKAKGREQTLVLCGCLVSTPVKPPPKSGDDGEQDE